MLNIITNLFSHIHYNVSTTAYCPVLQDEAAIPARIATPSSRDPVRNHKVFVYTMQMSFNVN